MVLAAVTGLASASVGGLPTIRGTGTAVQDDIGTCNNAWASDTLTKTFKLSATSTAGTFSLDVKEQGAFTTNAGSSPGACETGTDNGGTVSAGIIGKSTQQFDTTAYSSSAPNVAPDCSANACGSSGGFLDAVFGSGNWAKDAWTWNGHYTAGSNGTWYDTSTNWPLNDRGDITG